MGNTSLKSVIANAFCCSCPSCEGKVYPKLAGFKGCRLGLFYCKNCNTYMKLSNGLFLASLYGWFCGALLVSSQYWRLGSEWLRIIVVISICWFVMWPVFVRLLGHLKIVTDLSKLKQLSPKARMWHSYASFCFWLSVVLVLSSSLGFWFYTKGWNTIFQFLMKLAEQLKVNFFLTIPWNQFNSVC